ncbi:hypothetical protein HK405_007842 [Cladochytrium tenue]|nr:hypothetical protein HK405_007842 [Cladochytrium tenue]
MTNHLFAVDSASGSTDRVVHTATTAHVARVPTVRSMIAHCMEDVKPAAVQGVEALKMFFEGTDAPTEEKMHCAFPLAYEDAKRRGTNFFDFIETYEKPGLPKGFRGQRYAEAMQAMTQTSSVGIDAVLKVYDWEALGEATVVDLGGSAGYVSVMIAKKHPKLKLIVQDLASAEPAFRANNPIELASRVIFQEHDFFTPQTVQADAYLIKSVLHDWSDKYVTEILQQLLPAMKSGRSRIILIDVVLPPDFDTEGKPVVPRSITKLLSGVDLQMHLLCNSKERTVGDWVAVIKRADPRFELTNVQLVPGAPLGILELVLQE